MQIIALIAFIFTRKRKQTIGDSAWAKLAPDNEESSQGQVSDLNANSTSAQLSTQSLQLLGTFSIAGHRLCSNCFRQSASKTASKLSKTYWFDEDKLLAYR